MQPRCEKLLGVQPILLRRDRQGCSHPDKNNVRLPAPCRSTGSEDPRQPPPRTLPTAPDSTGKRAQAPAQPPPPADAKRQRQGKCGRRPRMRDAYRKNGRFCGRPAKNWDTYRTSGPNVIIFADKVPQDFAKIAGSFPQFRSRHPQIGALVRTGGWFWEVCPQIGPLLRIRGRHPVHAGCKTGLSAPRWF